MKLSSSGVISFTYEAKGRPIPFNVWMIFILASILNVSLIMGWGYCVYKTITDTNYWYTLGAVVGTMIFVGRDS